MWKTLVNDELFLLLIPKCGSVVSNKSWQLHKDLSWTMKSSMDALSLTARTRWILLDYWSPT